MKVINTISKHKYDCCSVLCLNELLPHNDGYILHSGQLCLVQSVCLITFVVEIE